MKKGLIKAFTIINFLFVIGTLIVLFLGVYRVESFGTFVVDKWNDVFNQAKTIEGLWIKLPKVCAIALSIEFVYGIFLFILDEICYSEHCELDVPPSAVNININENVNTDEKTVYKTRIRLGRNKNQKSEKGSKGMKSREERKALREAKKAQAKELKKNKLEEVEAEVKKQEEKQADAVSDFLNRLKK